MNIFITGGTGFIGRHLIDLLISSGYNITITSRKPESYRFLLSSNINLIKWRGEISHELIEAIEESDVIINLAGENIAGDNMVEFIKNRWTSETKVRLTDSRVGLGRIITEAIKKARKKPKLLIQASAVGYYGNAGNDILTEDSPPGNDFLASLCVEWENSTKAIEAFGIRRVVIRTAGMVMGSNKGSFPHLVLPFRFFVGGPIGNGRQWSSWIHIEDQIHIIKYLIENDRTQGIYNISAPEMVQNYQVSKIIGEILHRPSSIPLPNNILKIIFGDKSTLLTASQRQSSQKLQNSGYNFIYPNFRSAAENLLTPQ